MTIRSLCLDCSRDGNGCWDRNDAEPLVHCTTFVSKASATHCPVCLDHPAPTTTCRMCGAEGEPFIVGEEANGWSKPNDFQISDLDETLRAENQHLRVVLRHIADTSEDEFSRELARKAIDP